MKNWDALIVRIAEAGGVGTPDDARACGVSEATWHRRTRTEEWGRPHPRVRVAPWAPQGPLTDLRAALAACRGNAVAAGTTALWLAGVGSTPRVFDLMAAHRVAVPMLDSPRVRVRRARWIDDADIVCVDGCRRLHWPAAIVSLAGLPAHELRGLVIDSIQAGRVTPDAALERLATVGPITGRADLERVLAELGGRRPESWFHDIPLSPYLVGVEPEGDRFHRDATSRRNDRRRGAQSAGTSWVIVPVDWRDWHQRRAWVLATIDAAISRQLEAGHGTRRDLPPHLRPDQAEAS